MRSIEHGEQVAVQRQEDLPLPCKSFLGADAALKTITCNAMHVKSQTCESLIASKPC